MTPPLAMSVRGKKYLWDGEIYNSENEAVETCKSYEKDGFDIHMFKQDNKYLVYSRRIAVTEESSD